MFNSEGQRTACRSSYNVSAVSVRFEKIGMGKGILAKTRNIQFYEKACSISPVVTLKTDVTKEKKTKYHLRSCLNRTAQNRHTVNVYWC